MDQGFQPTQAQLNTWGGQIYSRLQPHEVAELRGWFASVDKDRSGTISLSELSQMQFGGKKFSQQTAKMLMNVFDEDRDGTIGFFEYCVLHKFITGMQGAFYAFDRDGSNSLELHEVRQALAQGGFQFSEATVQMIFKKFQSKVKATASTAGRYGAGGKYGATSAAGKANKNKGLDFETFIQMSAYLGQVRSTFTLHDKDRDGWLTINLETLVQLSTVMPS